jgi:hypothetical protein
MYIVVSKWTINPGKEKDFDDISAKMREFMRTLPGVEFEHGLRTEDGSAVAIVGYTDEAAYKNVMAPGGPFEAEASKTNIENIGKWLWSERGESLDRETANA